MLISQRQNNIRSILTKSQSLISQHKAKVMIATFVGFITLTFIAILCIEYNMNYITIEDSRFNTATSMSRQPLSDDIPYSAQEELADEPFYIISEPIVLDIITPNPKQRWWNWQFEFVAIWQDEQLGQGTMITIRHCTKHTTFDDIITRLQQYWPELNPYWIEIFEDGNKIEETDRALVSKKSLGKHDYTVKRPKKYVEPLNIDITYEELELDPEENQDYNPFTYYSRIISNCRIPKEFIKALKSKAHQDRIQHGELNNMLKQESNWKQSLEEWVHSWITRYSAQINNVEARNDFKLYFGGVAAALEAGDYVIRLINTAEGKETFKLQVTVRPAEGHEIAIPIFSIDKQVLTEFDDWYNDEY